MAFARVNAIVVNPEWWEEAWNPYLKRADYLFFKCQADMDRFLAAYAAKEACPYEGKALLIPWACLLVSAPKTGNEWLWLLGGSVNKREAALKILPLWKAEWPPLLVYTTSPLSLDAPLASNVTLRVEDLGSKKRQELQASSPCHLIFSASEALCMSAMEGEACGAFLLGNSLPTYVENFGSADYIHLTQSTLEPYKAGVKDTFAGIHEHLEAGILAVTKSARKAGSEKGIYRRNAFKAALQKILGSISTGPWPMPSPWQPMRFLSDEELPKISVVTLTYNRKKFLDLAFHNILVTDYPKDKIEWVIVDDSDDPKEQASDKIIKFGRENGPLTMTYIPLAKRTIGRKRNVGIFRAEHPIILFMDDDDHYPPSSFRRRVSALLTHPWKPEAVVCTTIACYDLQHGISAVNTPPWSLGLSKRVSEATLTFYKSFWEVKNFPMVNMAEGDEFIEGRADSVLEIPPQQIIVAMSHGSNSTTRRFPTGGSPSCFWGFPKEFLVFLHGLVGVEVEA
jgi:hypothetical protein